MTERLTALRQQFRRGEFDKHEFSRQVNVHHLGLRDHAELLVGTDIRAIELTAGTVTFISRFHNARFPCDPADRGLPPVVALDFGSYEEKDFATLLELVPRGGVFVDIGANIGWYSIHAALADPSVNVIAVEPIPGTFKWLTAAIAANGLVNVKAINVAISSKREALSIYFDSTSSGAASAAPSTGSDGLVQVPIQAVTLDDIVVENGGKVDVLKLDIEGGEFAALRGAGIVLSQCRPVVFCEMLRKLSRPFGYHPNEIIAFMREYGYSCFRCENRCLIRFESMDEETTETNFYFLHEVAHQSLHAHWVRQSK